MEKLRLGVHWEKKKKKEKVEEEKEVKSCSIMTLLDKRANGLSALQLCVNRNSP